jgi:hypothetical protein
VRWHFALLRLEQNARPNRIADHEALVLNRMSVGLCTRLLQSAPRSKKQAKHFEFVDFSYAIGDQRL